MCVWVTLRVYCYANTITSTPVENCRNPRAVFTGCLSQDRLQGCASAEDFWDPMLPLDLAFCFDQSDNTESEWLSQASNYKHQAVLQYGAAEVGSFFFAARTSRCKQAPVAKRIAAEVPVSVHARPSVCACGWVGGLGGWVGTGGRAGGLGVLAGRAWVGGRAVVRCIGWVVAQCLEQQNRCDITGEYHMFGLPSSATSAGNLVLATPAQKGRPGSKDQTVACRVHFSAVMRYV